MTRNRPGDGAIFLIGYFIIAIYKPRTEREHTARAVAVMGGEWLEMIPKQRGISCFSLSFHSLPLPHHLIVAAHRRTIFRSQLPDDNVSIWLRTDYRSGMGGMNSNKWEEMGYT